MNLDWSKGSEALTYLKGLGTKVKQIALQLTEVEIKVEDATNNDPWGPHGKDMADITKAAYDLESYKQIMGVIARRLQDQGEDWRHVYKSLLLLEYMAKHGPQKVVDEIVSNIGVIEKLTFFEHKDANGKDWGLNVRQRAKELVALVNDPERIRSERHKAKSNESKYTGVSSDDLRGFGSKSSGLGSASSWTPTAGTSSKYKSTGLGATGFGSSSRGSLYDDYDEPVRTSEKDPKEATRERIERLKREGVVDPDDPGAIPPARAPAVSKSSRSLAPEGKAEEVQRVAKKLSDVKVNPSIAASLGQLPVPPSAQASSNGTAAAAARPQPAAADLLLELDAPASQPPAAASGPGHDSAWSAFEGGNVPAAQTDFLAFGTDTGASSLTASAAAGSDPFQQLASSSTSRPRAAAPMMQDPFSALAAPASGMGSTSLLGDPFAEPKSTAGAASKGQASAVLPEDLFAPAPGAFGLGSQLQAHQDIGFHQGSQANPGFAAFPQASAQPAAWQQPQQQQPVMPGFASFQPAAAGNPGQAKISTATSGSAGLSSSGPLNPAASQALGGPIKSKDPFADLAAF